MADLPATTPFLVTSSIVIGDGTAVGSQVIQAVGLMVHFTISIFYGMAFGLITPWLRTNGTVAVAGVAFGGLIYAVDFQVIARIWFPVFTRQDQPVALLVHPHLRAGGRRGVLQLRCAVRRAGPQCGPAGEEGRRSPSLHQDLSTAWPLSGPLMIW